MWPCQEVILQGLLMGCAARAALALPVAVDEDLFIPCRDNLEILIPTWLLTNTYVIG